MTRILSRRSHDATMSLYSMNRGRLKRWGLLSPWLTVVCIRYPLSLRQVEYLLHERGINICHETVRF